MAGYQANFERVEMKYILSPVQKRAVLDAAKGHVSLDGYGRTEVRSIYFDTESFLLARRSIDRPRYKEKLRLRSYGRPADDTSRVFAELKKKYDGIVYKRRMAIPLGTARRWLVERKDAGLDSQIFREIDYMFDHYEGLRPKMWLSYEREAYHPEDGSDFRMTLDENILARTKDVNVSSSAWGTDILPGCTLMELKTGSAVPLWMTETMSRNGIWKTSFSKYGTAYKMLFRPRSDYELTDREIAPVHSVVARQCRSTGGNKTDTWLNNCFTSRPLEAGSDPEAKE